MSTYIMYIYPQQGIDIECLLCYYIDVMTNIQHKLENIIYSYDANQFMPIWDMDGKLTNKNKFIAYKAKRVVNLLLSCNK